MHRANTVPWGFLALVITFVSLPVFAQDSVTISKSRLQELEREEAELRRLKGENAPTNAPATSVVVPTSTVQKPVEEAVGTAPPAAQPHEEHAASTQPPSAAVPQGSVSQTATTQQDLTPPNAGGSAAAGTQEDELQKLKSELEKTRDQNARLQKQHEADAAKFATAAPPQPVHVSPAMASLPPLKDGETVDAMDLANHYLEDAVAADRRYLNRTFLVKGEVVRFEKPLIARTYKIILKTSDRQMKVVCNVFTPEIYKASFTARDGAEIVGLTPREERVTLAKVGDTVLIGGCCNGLRGSTLGMSGCELKPSPRR